jgi:uncharacterized phage protein (TIGR01671 family)
MREILFEAKRKDNGEWIEGWFLGAECTTSIINDNHHIFPVIPETVRRYTGLTDKNGKKIFEGDIIYAKTVDTNTSQIATVGFGNFIDANNDDEYLGFYIEFDSIKTTITQLNLEILKNRFEVIGNIHDNPELLKGE